MGCSGVGVVLLGTGGVLGSEVGLEGAPVDGGGVSLLLAAAVMSGKAADIKPRSWHVDRLRYSLEASGLK